MYNYPYSAKKKKRKKELFKKLELKNIFSRAKYKIHKDDFHSAWFYRKGKKKTFSFRKKSKKRNKIRRKSRKEIERFSTEVFISEKK